MADMVPIKVIVDAAETRSGIIDILKRTDGYQIEVKTLDCGDYLVGDNCVVERKAAVDFFASILDGRFISQAKLMSESFGRCIYIIEGNLHKTPHNFTKAAMYGALSFLSVLEGISIIPSASIEETAALVATMARHAQQGLGYVPALRVSKPKEKETSKLYVIEGLPGIGGKRAKDVLAYFGSVAKVFSASREEWLTMPGMGKSTVDKIFTVIHGV